MQRLALWGLILFSAPLVAATEKVVAVSVDEIRVSQNEEGVVSLTVTYGKDGQTLSRNYGRMPYRNPNRSVVDYAWVFFQVRQNSLYVYDTDEANRIGDIDKDGKLTLNGPMTLSLGRFDNQPTLFEQVWHRRKAFSNFDLIVVRKPAAKPN